jgi:hypothetical protein
VRTVRSLEAGGALADAENRLLGHVGGVEAVDGARAAVVAPSTPW